MAQSKSKKEKLLFQEALNELQAINQWLSEEPTNYDELIDKVKRAKLLLDFCSNQLTQGETIIHSIFEK